ncbi:cytochrome c [Gellertiella hungarica]|uniref:Mono/diheme cytochrome c family protein n=1 Tax=Gellertiella hungarica TaxID=1572859 RepID=A0A7W6J874_9HYPH|nr:cytochrome c [Gellertiella hungarica]MBB4066583.1 mono/diheme cytochrome c family protein [Gellertiella hungarica]
MRHFASTSRSAMTIGLVAAGLAMACAVAAGWFLSAPTVFFEEGGATLPSGDPERGKLVFLAGQCASCHASPGQPDRLKLGGGIAIASPYGTFRAPNISPHPADGIGRWSPEAFGNALVSGVSPAGEHYYPVFPYIGYTAMKVQDIADLYAYMKTLPPVSGRAPDHDLPAIFRIRRAIGLWKLAFFRERQSKATMTGEPVHDRGGYLSETLLHCAECHSSRNVFGAVSKATRFAGGPDPEDTGFVPNITPGRIGAWSEEDLVRMMQTGQTPGHGRVGSSMADVVVNLRGLPRDDLVAIARYIKSLPARETPKP